MCSPRKVSHFWQTNKIQSLKGMILGASETNEVRIQVEIRRRRRLLSDVVKEITAEGGGLCMSENLSRDELYAKRFQIRDALQ